MGSKGIVAAEAIGRRVRRGDMSQAGRPPARPLDLARSEAPDALVTTHEAYLQSLRVRHYSPLTLQSSLDDFKAFLSWAQERDLTRASEITRPILEAFQQALWRHRKADGQPLSWSTQRRRVSHLKGFFRWLTRQNVLLHNPASELELPRPEKRLPATALSLAQVEQLMAVPDLTDALGVRDRAMLEVFYATGLRRAELCAAHLGDLNRARGTLTVRLGKGKKDRVVPVGARALSWVNRYLEEVRPRLLLDVREPTLFLSGFGGGFHPQVVSHLVTACLRRIGARGSCHLLRHTCATHMLEGGADIRFIQQQLGHEKLETTAIYTEVTIRQLLEVHTRCHPSGQLPPAGESAQSQPCP